MEYLKPSFTVSLGSKDFSENYDRIFRKRGIVEGDAAAEDAGSSTNDNPEKIALHNVRASVSFEIEETEE